MLKYLTAAVIVIAPLSACHNAAQPERVEPAPTIPTMDPLGSKATFSAATFRNVTHDSISPRTFIKTAATASGRVAGA